MTKSIYIIFIVCTCAVVHTAGQNITLNGKVFSANGKHQPLAFVKITSLKTHVNAISDIDGQWKFNKVPLTDTLVFTYLGYATQTVPVSHFDLKQKEQTVYLAEKESVLDEVTIKPMENPANRILRQVIARKQENNYANIKCYAYFEYTNMHAAIVSLDSSDNAQENLPLLTHSPTIDTAKQHKTDKSLDSFSQKQYAFMIETVESVAYRSPGKLKKNMLAYHVSGINDARISLFANTYENFSIYNNDIELGEKNYVSPIASNAIKDYLFIIEDTIWSPEKDTIFVISYRPRSHKTFNGFEGTLYINSKNYAVQDIIANPLKSSDGVSLQLRQQFEFVNNTHWFPVRQEVGIDFAKLSEDDNRIIQFQGKSTYENINFDTLIPKRDFSDVETTVATDAGQKDSLFWDKYRGRPLSRMEKTTYKVIDSIAKVAKLSKLMGLFSGICTQRIPIGKLDLDLGKVFAYNDYEQYRLGLGLYTNDKISRYFSVGGYYGYGFGDKASKYGGSLDIKPIPASFFKFGVSYSNDVYEFGGTRFGLEDRVPYLEQIRYFGINDMFSSLDKSAYVQFRLPIPIQIKGSLSQNTLHTNESYQYLSADHLPGSDYNITEARVGLRYAYKETLVKLPSSEMVQPFPRGPVIYFQYTRGLKDLSGTFNYDKYDLKITKKFMLSNFGFADVEVSSGLINGAVPLFEAYNAPANFWGSFQVAAQNCFETMRTDEFFDSRYINLFYKETLAWHPYKNKYSAPIFSLREDIGYGQLDHEELNAGLNYKTMSKGFYESGLVIDNFYKLSSYSGLGLGFFYRYGPYSLNGFRNNLAIKLTLSSAFLE